MDSAAASGMDSLDDEAPRWARFRRRITVALPFAKFVLPVGLLLASVGYVVVDGWGNFGVVAAVAALTLIGLVVHDRLLALHRARGGSAILSRRDAVVAVVLLICGASWIVGSAGMSAPSGPSGQAALAYIHGMFGVAVTLGLLIASAVRRPRSA